MANNCKNMYEEYKNGSMYNINFGRTFHPELKDMHLGIIFNIKTCYNMVLCFPLTSPKEKHFKSLEGFNNRVASDLKYSHLYYIAETDSIVMLEQFRTISKRRIHSQYKNKKSNKKEVISVDDMAKLINKFKKFMKLNLQQY